MKKLLMKPVRWAAGIITIVCITALVVYGALAALFWFVTVVCLLLVSGIATGLLSAALLIPAALPGAWTFWVFALYKASESKKIQEATKPSGKNDS